jgi:gamma-glutamyl-gamma-aminobutyrate hydrolase PuuD
MAETQEQWYNRQAIEHLAQHIPFERDSASKAEQIEMLRGLVIRHGRSMDPDLFGFDARNELKRLGLWNRIGPERPQGEEPEPEE